MRFTVEEALDLLSRTPGTLDRFLRGLPGNWVAGNEGPETWSPFDVVGHLIHGERTDWMPRVNRLLQDGEARPFTPFDRFAQFRESEGRSLDELLDTFASLREQNLSALRRLRLSEDELARTGTHPAFGRVTLRQLLSTWVVHDLGHLAQIARTMARQYAGEVGPWEEYLPVLGRR